MVSFDHVNHEWLLKFLQQRIKDRRVLRLIVRMLKAGVMEDGLRQSVARFTDWIRRYRGLLPTGELLRRAKARVVGHLNYYAMTDNYDHCKLYVHLVCRSLFKWLNRRSQRKSYTWKGYLQPLCHVGWPKVRIRIQLNPFSPTPNV